MPQMFGTMVACLRRHYRVFAPRIYRPCHSRTWGGVPGVCTIRRIWPGCQRYDDRTSKRTAFPHKSSFGRGSTASRIRQGPHSLSSARVCERGSQPSCRKHVYRQKQEKRNNYKKQQDPKVEIDFWFFWVSWHIFANRLGRLFKIGTHPPTHPHTPPTHPNTQNQ